MDINFDIDNAEARAALRWAAEVAARGDVHEFVLPESFHQGGDVEAETRAYIEAALLEVLFHPEKAELL